MSRKISFILILSLFAFSVAGIPLAAWNNNVAHTELNSYALADSEAFPRGPTVNMVNKTAAMIYWETNTQTNATVKYGSTFEDLDSTVENSTLSKEHRVWIDGLTAGTTVYYQAISDETSSNIYHFKTEPEDGEPFKLVVLSDPQPTSAIAPDQSQVFKDIIDMVRNEEPHLILILGDYVDQLSDTDESYNDLCWNKYLNVSDKAGHYAPIYGVIGNHDTISGDHYADGFLEAFQQYGEDSTYFSFDYAGVHFTLLDTEMPEYQGRISGAQYDWLVNDLENTDKEVKFVMGHQPMYPVSAIGSSLDRNRTERNRLQNLLEEHNVTAYLAGHDHVFQRLTVNGVLHVTTAGAGPKLYSTPWGGDFHHYTRWNVSETEIQIESINTDGEVAADYALPYEGSIEIALRRFFNTSAGRPEQAPLILFSEVPEEKYFSWDGGDNSTELGTFPDTNGLHTLDVYAKGLDGVWNHKHYAFDIVGGEETETTTSPPPSSIEPFVIAGVIGAAAVIAAILIYRWKTSKK
ncbi:MAG: metallophosphoesterase family protein [Candidatus Thorarchaeota archaeon]|nr:metallophosphoesterase family protein [Candidatus Thorarchaeota archaeon]